MLKCTARECAEKYLLPCYTVTRINNYNYNNCEIEAIVWNFRMCEI